MKKVIVITLVVIVALLSANLSYAQGGVTVSTTAGSIDIGNTAVDAGDSSTAVPPNHISWGTGDAGSIAFPGGQSITVGGSANNVINEIELVGISSAATQETRVRLVSGCITVVVPANSANPFVVESDNGNNSVRISPAATVQVCQTPTGNLVVTRLSGDGQVQVLSGNVVVVSDVQGQAGVSSGGCTILNASGIGIGTGPCP